MIDWVGRIPDRRVEQVQYMYIYTGYMYRIYIHVYVYIYMYIVIHAAGNLHQHEGPSTRNMCT